MAIVWIVFFGSARRAGKSEKILGSMGIIKQFGFFRSRENSTKGFFEGDGTERSWKGPFSLLKKKNEGFRKEEVVHFPLLSPKRRRSLQIFDQIWGGGAGPSQFTLQTKIWSKTRTHKIPLSLELKMPLELIHESPGKNVGNLGQIWFFWLPTQIGAGCGALCSTFPALNRKFPTTSPSL